MIIYNVTINVNESIHSAWLKWMQNKHINDVLSTGLFTNAKMVKVYLGRNGWWQPMPFNILPILEAKLEDYYKNHAQDYAKRLTTFADKMLAFRTELEVMEEFYGETNVKMEKKVTIFIMFKKQLSYK